MIRVYLGLSVTDLRTLHDGSLWSPFADLSAQTGVLPLVQARDPHQKLITVKRNPEGEEVLDRVAGR